MTKQTLPVAGDDLSDGFPSVEKIVKCTLGHALGDVTDSGVAGICTVPINAQVIDVGWMVEALFDGSLTITLGDTDNAAGWAEAADVGATTVDTYINWASAHDSASSCPAYVIAPPLYASCSEDIDYTMTGAAFSKGQLAVYVKYHMAYAQKYF